MTDRLLMFIVATAFILAMVIVLIVTSIAWLRRQTRGQDQEKIINNLKESFGALSFEALSRNTAEFLKIANETLARQTQDGAKELETKKRLIDQTLGSMKEELSKVQDLVSRFEKDREQKFGELSSQLKLTAEQTGKLHETANQLKSALVGTAVRGQWGQRMAEDVLRLAGFIEGVNYKKERTQESVNTRPDYTFFLPQGLIVNMDVKFPMNNYLKYLESQAQTDKERYKELFLKDVRIRIKEVTNRDYINPEEKTVDYVLVFIPNEQVYSFMNENDNALLDDALKNKVILCSPLTLYAILAVMRQAVDNFNLEKTAAHVLSLLGAFNKQWDAFIKSFDRLGKRIQDLQDEFNALTSTRRNQLDRQIKRIEDLRRQEGIAESIPTEEDAAIPADSIEVDEKIRS